MDTRAHVASALERLVRRTPTWPPTDVGIFRNLLLDEAGGDHRPLIDFLLQLSEMGVPAKLSLAHASGTPWTALRSRLTLELTNERFLQGDAVRWGIEAWGVALRIPGATLTPAESASPARPSPIPAAPASPSGAPSSVARAPVTPATRSSPPAWRAPSPALSPPPTAPIRRFASGNTMWERYAVSSITMMLIVAVMFMWYTRSSVRDTSREAGAPPASRVTERRDGSGSLQELPGRMVAPPVVSSGDTVFLSSGDTIAGRLERLGRGTVRLHLASGAPMREIAIASIDALALKGGARLDRRALLQAASITDAPPADSGSTESYGAGLAGSFVVHARRASVEGDARCSSIGGAIDWDQQTLESVSVRHDSTGAPRRFAFVSRPGVEGLVSPDGAFESEALRYERDGTRYAFRLAGHVTPRGFEAIGETWTETTVRWRNVVRCRFAASLTGTRLR